jgi:hypothetical protein
MFDDTNENNNDDKTSRKKISSFGVESVSQKDGANNYTKIELKKN